MIERLHDLYSRVGNSRPGLSPVALLRVAIPVTMLRLVANVQRRKPIPLLHEIILRSVETGIRSPQSIADLTGLDHRIIAETVAELAVSGHAIAGASAEIRLSPSGKALSNELALITPSVDTLNISFDRLTWKIAPYHTSRLINRRDCVEKGITRIPASQTRSITRSDVTVSDLREMIGRPDRENNSIDYLGLVDLKPRASKYIEAELVLFANSASSQLDAALLVDDDPSEVHSLAFLSGGGLKSIGVSLELTNVQPVLPSPHENLSGLSSFEYASLLFDKIRSAKAITIVVATLDDTPGARQLLAMLTQQLERSCKISFGILNSEKDDPINRRLRDSMHPFDSQHKVSFLTGDDSNTLAGIYLDSLILPWVPEALSHQSPPKVSIHRIHPVESAQAHKNVLATLSKKEPDLGQDSIPT